MKNELIELIKKNYKDLDAEQVDELANKIYGLLPTKKRKLCDIKVGDTFKYAGYDFTKLADEENSCYCLMSDTVFESEFGETNDWAKSPIRKQLNEFDGQGKSKAVKGIAKDDLVAVSLNYTAYKIPNGRSTDAITCLSYEEYLAYDFLNVDKHSWLRSGSDYDASNAYVLGSSGGYGDSYAYRYFAVRPALHFKKDLEIEV